MAQLASLRLQLGDWALTRERALEADLLQARKAATAKRNYQELEIRLKTLEPDLLEALAVGPQADRRQLSFVACCLTYPFLAHFTEEVLWPKVQTYQFDVRHADYAQWFAREADRYPRLHTLAESTSDKLRSRTFRVLEEADLLDADKHLVPPYVAGHLESLLRRLHPRALRWLLLPAGSLAPTPKP